MGLVDAQVGDRRVGRADHLRRQQHQVVAGAVLQRGAGLPLVQERRDVVGVDVRAVRRRAARAGRVARGRVVEIVRGVAAAVDQREAVEAQRLVEEVQLEGRRRVRVAFPGDGGDLAVDQVGDAETRLRGGDRAAAEVLQAVVHAGEAIALGRVGVDDDERPGGDHGLHRAIVGFGVAPDVIGVGDRQAPEGVRAVPGDQRGDVLEPAEVVEVVGPGHREVVGEHLVRRDGIAGERDLRVRRGPRPAPVEVGGCDRRSDGDRQRGRTGGAECAGVARVRLRAQRVADDGVVVGPGKGAAWHAVVERCVGLRGPRQADDQRQQDEQVREGTRAHAALPIAPPARHRRGRGSPGRTSCGARGTGPRRCDGHPGSRGPGNPSRCNRR